MFIDLHDRATRLLGDLANAMHDRDPSNPTIFCFTSKEFQVVQDCLRELIDDMNK